MHCMYVWMHVCMDVCNCVGFFPRRYFMIIEAESLFFLPSLLNRFPFLFFSFVFCTLLLHVRLASASSSSSSSSSSASAFTEQT